MGVYIKDMEMPTSCRQCGLYLQSMDSERNVYENCAVTAKSYNWGLTTRPSDCPLVYIPPHGRLIEDVAVREQIDEWLDSVGDVVVGHGLSYYGELLGCIEDAPTIIPAEEGET